MPMTTFALVDLKAKTRCCAGSSQGGLNSQGRSYVALADVMLLAGFLGWRAEATTLTGSATLLAETHSYPPVENVACGGPGPNCPAELHWV